MEVSAHLQRHGPLHRTETADQLESQATVPAVCLIFRLHMVTNIHNAVEGSLFPLLKVPSFSPFLCLSCFFFFFLRNPLLTPRTTEDHWIYMFGTETARIVHPMSRARHGNGER